MIFDKRPRWRILGMLDVVALLAVTAASVWAAIQYSDPLYWLGPVFAGMWAGKAWILSDVSHVWFPARFGMNEAGVYNIWLPWAICMLLLLAYVILETFLHHGWYTVPLLCGVARAAIPHTVMGWWSAKQMVRMPPGGE